MAGWAISGNGNRTRFTISLYRAVTASLRGAPEPDIRTLLEKRVFTPIGMPQTDWSIGYGESTDLDGLIVYANWGGGGLTPRAAAPVGQLLLQKGAWDGRRIVGAEWIEKMVAMRSSFAPISGSIRSVGAN